MHEPACLEQKTVHIQQITL